MQGPSSDSQSFRLGGSASSWGSRPRRALARSVIPSPSPSSCPGNCTCPQCPPSALLGAGPREAEGRGWSVAGAALGLVGGKP